MSTHPYGQQRPCAQCQHFGGWQGGGAAVWCLDGKIVHSLPNDGCAYWTPKTEKAPQPEGQGANVRRT